MGIKPGDVPLPQMQVSQKTPIMLLLFKAYDIINLSILNINSKEDKDMDLVLKDQKFWLDFLRYEYRIAKIL